MANGAQTKCRSGAGDAVLERKRPENLSHNTWISRGTEVIGGIS